VRGETVTAQDTILRACSHSHKPCDVNMGRGEILPVCAECWNQSVYARRTNRKAQLADHWRQYREEQSCAMREAGAVIGQRVSYFCRSMLGFGGMTVTGRIAVNRNGIAVIRLDRIVDGKRQAAWSKGWRPI
jgi:hypothetical protein